MPKLIIHIGSSIQGGGAQSVLRDTLKILNKYDNKNNHKLICKDESNDNQYVNYRFINEKNMLSSVFSFSNRTFLKNILFIEKPSIIHLHHYTALSPSILSAVFSYKKKYKVKVIHSVHTFEYVCAIHAAYDYKKNKRCLDCAKQTFKYKVFFRNCSYKGILHSFGKGLSSLITSYYNNKNIIDYWTTPSEFLKANMLSQKYVKNDKISVLRNPILDVDKTPDLITKERDPFKFVFFGRFSEEKNIEFIINAFNKLLLKKGNFKLILIGKGEKEIELKKLVKSLNIDSYVDFIPFLAKKDLDLKLKECHVSLLSSKCFETASMVVVESVQLDLITIVCNHGGMKEMINFCDVGLSFSDSNQKDLVDKMYQAYYDYDVLIKQVRYSKRNNLKVFSEHQYYNNLMNLYCKF